MKRRWLKRGLIAGFILLFVLSLAICVWLVWGQNLAFQWMLPKYPGAQMLTEAHGYYGAGTEDVTLYYWTKDSIQTVVSHFEGLTLPFIEAKYPFEPDIKDYYRTVVDLSGGQIPPIMTTEFGHEVLYPIRDRRCHYTLRNSCVVIELLGFAESERVTLRPYPAPQRMYRTPEPLSPDLTGGTLIVYLYYVDDFS